MVFERTKDSLHKLTRRIDGAKDSTKIVLALALLNKEVRQRLLKATSNK